MLETRLQYSGKLQGSSEIEVREFHVTNTVSLKTDLKLELCCTDSTLPFNFLRNKSEFWQRSELNELGAHFTKPPYNVAQLTIFAGDLGLALNSRKLCRKAQRFIIGALWRSFHNACLQDARPHNASV